MRFGRSRSRTGCRRATSSRSGRTRRGTCGSARRTASTATTVMSFATTATSAATRDARQRLHLRHRRGRRRQSLDSHERRRPRAHGTRHAAHPFLPPRPGRRRQHRQRHRPELGSRRGRHDLGRDTRRGSRPLRSEDRPRHALPFRRHRRNRQRDPRVVRGLGRHALDRQRPRSDPLLERHGRSRHTSPHDANDPASLSDARVRSIFEDSRGRLWVGTYGGGLNRFDRERGVFERFRHDRFGRLVACERSSHGYFRGRGRPAVGRHDRRPEPARRVEPQFRALWPRCGRCHEPRRRLRDGDFPGPRRPALGRHAEPRRQQMESAHVGLWARRRARARCRPGELRRT